MPLTWSATFVNVPSRWYRALRPRFQLFKTGPYTSGANHE